MKSINIFILITSSLIIQTAVALPSVNQDSGDDWVRTVLLDTDSKVSVRWRNELFGDKDNGGEKSQWLIMEMFTPTKGYVGVGFSPHGGMMGSDIVIGWVDANGKGYLKDMHGVGNQVPVEDSQNDYELISATETEDGTTIRFKRKWNTCDDKHDRQITNETTKLIYATGDKDPIQQGNQWNFNYHGTKRGVKSVLLQNEAKIPIFPDDPSNPDPNVKYWDVLMNNHQVDKSDTTYYCKIQKAPPVPNKHHLIGFRPIIQPENRRNVHHFCFYECIVPEEHGGTENIFEEHLKHPGSKCYVPDMPRDWGKYCSAFTFVWLLGSDGEMLPEHVGIPIGEQHNGATYFMLEVHYDNPEQREFIDSSGVRLFYTDKLRQYDGGIMLMGHRISPFQMVPPRQESFLTSAICSSECTREGIPPDGIKIISMLHHAHLAGRKLRQRHFRNGVELPKVAEDNYYDFNYQQSHNLQNEVTVLPGDELITECDYNTVDRDDVVLGGLSTRDEMCQSFMVYYPRVQLNNCGSQPELYSFFSALGINNVSGSTLADLNVPYDPATWPKEQQLLDPPDNAKEVEKNSGQKNIFDTIDIVSPASKSHLKTGQFMREMNWKDQKLGKAVEKAWRDGKHYSYCTAHGRKRIPLKNPTIEYTKIDQVYEEPVDLQCKENARLRSSGVPSKLSLTSSSILSFLVLSFKLLC